jgi:hypothetical protein
MFRVAVVAAAIVAAMILVKDRSILEHTGLLSSCTAVAAPPGDFNFWEACKPGKLEGRPNLVRRSCESMRGRPRRVLALPRPDRNRDDDLTPAP